MLPLGCGGEGTSSNGAGKAGAGSSPDSSDGSSGMQGNVGAGSDPSGEPATPPSGGDAAELDLVEVEDRSAVAVGWGAGVFWIDVTDSKAPKLASSWQVEGNVERLRYDADTQSLAVSMGEEGLQVFGVSTPAEPKSVLRYVQPESDGTVQLSDQTSLMSTPEVRDAWVAGDQVYVAAYPYAVRVLSTDDASVQGAFTTRDARKEDDRRNMRPTGLALDLDRNILFVSSAAPGGLFALDVSKAGSITIRDHLYVGGSPDSTQTPPAELLALAYQSGRLLPRQQPGGKASLAKYQIVMDTGQEHLLSCDPNGGGCTPEANKGNTAISALQVISNTGGIDGAPSQDLALDPSGEVAAMLVDLEVSDDSEELALALFEIRGKLGELAIQNDPEGQLDIAGSRAAVALTGQHAFVFNDRGVLSVLDSSDPKQPKVLGSLELD